MRLVAIDFETADTLPDSACAVGLVVVEDGRVTHVRHALIRPPRRVFQFTHLHGICWDDVAGEPEFGTVWNRLVPLTTGATFLLAHNASFDRRVLAACCESTGCMMPSAPFVCTVRIARHAWNIRPTKLPNVCQHLGIPLEHHKAESDALACARIAIAALRQGISLEIGMVGNVRLAQKKSVAVPRASFLPPAADQAATHFDRSDIVVLDSEVRPPAPAMDTRSEVNNNGKSGDNSGNWIWAALVMAGFLILIALS